MRARFQAASSPLLSTLHRLIYASARFPSFTINSFSFEEGEVSALSAKRWYHRSREDLI